MIGGVLSRALSLHKTFSLHIEDDDDDDDVAKEEKCSHEEIFYSAVAFILMTLLHNSPYTCMHTSIYCIALLGLLLLLEENEALFISRQTLTLQLCSRNKIKIIHVMGM